MNVKLEVLEQKRHAAKAILLRSLKGLNDLSKSWYVGVWRSSIIIAKAPSQEDRGEKGEQVHPELF